MGERLRLPRLPEGCQFRPAEYEASPEPIDPVAEIERARSLVWGRRDPGTGR